MHIGSPKPLVMVVHGPELFDMGLVHRLKETLGPTRIVVAGVMARTAAEESGLEVECPGVPPSVAIKGLDGNVFLANCGKTPESGRIFGEIVAGRLGDRGLIQVECSGRVIYQWNGGDRDLAGWLSEKTGYRREHVVIEKTVDVPGYRTIRGCIPGEPVFVNGIVIGHATERTVVISIRDGHISPVLGIRIKIHGIEKLESASPLDPGNLWCKSGPVRRSSPGPGTAARSKTGNGRVITIDHCGFDVYRYLKHDVSGILSIGDDTTAVCGHVGAHLGIPVFGVTDGDEDTIVSRKFAPGSVIVLVTGGSDDDIGREISEHAEKGPVAWEPWVAEQIRRIGERGRVIYREPPVVRNTS